MDVVAIKEIFEDSEPSAVQVLGIWIAMLI
jgi:hypothetical protein